MSQASFNPSNLLKSVQDKIATGMTAEGVRLLDEFLSMRKRLWTPQCEPIIELLIRLSVEQCDTRQLRDGLYSYKSLAGSHAPESLAKVVNLTATLVEERVAKAFALCNNAKPNNIEDLEEGMNPETLMMTTVDALQERDRNQTAIFVPCLKFAWESFRNILELLKNNSTLEKVYHDICKRGYAFCLTYERKTEFRKMCEALRQHLTSQVKYAEGSRISETSTELHLITRFEQLRVATLLHQWLEGFRTIEDINSILSASPKKPSTGLMSAFYQRLTQMFLVSGSYLFHAYSYKQYYDLIAGTRGATNDFVKSTSSTVLLSTMSVPLPSSKYESSSNNSGGGPEFEKNRRMAQLLGIEATLERKELVASLLNSPRLLEDAAPEIKTLFLLLERTQDELNPATFVEKCVNLLQYVRSEFPSFSGSIETLVVIRLVSRLSRVFVTVKLSYFHTMIDQLQCPNLTHVNAERIIVGAAHAKQIPGGVNATVDHSANVIRFGTNVLEDAQTRDVLKTLALGLKDVLKDALAPSSTSVVSSMHEPIFSTADCASTFANTRKSFIAARKKEREDVLTSRARAKAEQDYHARQALEERNAARSAKIAEDNRLREEEKKEKEAEEIRQRARFINLGLDVSMLGTDVSLEEKEKLIKEKREKELSLQNEAETKKLSRLRRMDAFIRASREAERPAIAKAYDNRVESSRIEFERDEDERLIEAGRQHEESLGMKRRLMEGMQASKDAFDALMSSVWQSSIQRAKDEREEMRSSNRRAMKMERARSRYEDAVRKIRAEEEARKRQEFEEKRIREAEEELARKEKERAERGGGGGGGGGDRYERSERAERWRSGGGGDGVDSSEQAEGGGSGGGWRRGAGPPTVTDAPPQVDGGLASAPPPSSGDGKPTIWRPSRQRTAGGGGESSSRSKW